MGLTDAQCFAREIKYSNNTNEDHFIFIIIPEMLDMKGRPFI